MKRSGWFALAAIISFSLLMRTLPLYDYALWGMDAGEYLYYTQRWMESGGSYLSIDGWGEAYPFFPGIFILSGAFSSLSGADLTHSFNFTSVLISGLSPLFVFLIVHKLMDDWRPAILSSFYFAALPPLIYSYSQPKPETLGFFFLTFILALNVTLLREHKKVIVLMMMGVFALIITHHLSTYFLLLMLFGGFFVSRLWRSKEWPLDRHRMVLFVFFLAATLSYWLFYATTFAGNRIKGALGFPSYFIIVVPFLVLVFLELLVKLRRRFDISMPVNVHKQDMKSFLVFIGVALLIIVPSILHVTFGTFPVRDIKLGTTVLVYLPVAVSALLGVSSRKIIKAVAEGPSVIGWFTFILLSVLGGVLSRSSSLLPMRHVTFLLLSVSILFGIGIVQFHILTNPKRDMKKTLILSLILFILLASVVPYSFPSQERAGGYTEGVEWEDMEAGFWLKGSTSRKTATDHRMSSAAFSVENKNLTWTEGDDMYFSSDLTEGKEDLRYHNASYILWDQEMLNGTATQQGQNPKPLDPELKKDYHDNFYRVYLSEECESYVVR
ncbi:MAG: ArnT family glycosyltransferase [Candidatus Aenigmatarchaeota archaeon]